MTTANCSARPGTEPTRREPTFDRDGYPTDATLRVIREWPVLTFADCEALLAFVEKAWSDYGNFIREPRRRRRFRGAIQLERRYRLATGGWSGNESIIGALDRNQMFSMLCWESSSRGGAHEYRTCS